MARTAPTSSAVEAEAHERVDPAIARHDMTALKERCQRVLGWDAAKASKIVAEYRKFLTLKVRCEDEGDAELSLSPSGPIDGMWHQHLLDNRDYKKLCDAVGAFISHDPDGADDVDGRKSRAKATIAAYRARYERSPPEDVWDFGRSRGRKRRRAEDNSRDKNRYRYEETFQVFVTSITGKRITLEASPADTVGTFKHLIKDKEGIPPEVQRLIFRGRGLEDEKRLDECGVKRECTMYLVLKLRGC